MSSSKYHKQFEPGFKKEMVRLVQELGRSPVEVAKEIGITATSMRRWIKEYGNEADPRVFPGKGNQHPADEEIREIRRRMHDLEQENAILKKAMHIFAKDVK